LKYRVRKTSKQKKALRLRIRERWVKPLAKVILENVSGGFGSGQTAMGGSMKRRAPKGNGTGDSEARLGARVCEITLGLSRK